MCWFNNHHLPLNFDVEKPPANLIVSAPSAPAIDITLLFKVIAGHFGISSLRSLKIASNQVVLTKYVLALVKDLTKLDKIAIWKSGDALSEFLVVLKKGDHALTFPSLRSIELHGIDLDGELAAYSDTVIRVLAAILKSRTTIEQFAMTKCINFLEEHWEVLCEAPPEEVEMYWDKDVYVVESSEDDDEDSLWTMTISDR
ncbi:hypothetical protein EST38_g9425 [Candolleomyces aberdarensis]|uniref:Uncharacterized protein n=1 Tax=Candolleomyces aberdarensis TaxID=2316362 RepID=A0A4Q2DA17_9AGAR|nr:hypothetical protein EST38_g9425 [Candolleomyces aberdarensis]